jgi:hypothetical protein
MKKFIRETFGYIGFSSVFYGIYQIHVPAAFIICGSVLVWLSIPGKTK